MKTILTATFRHETNRLSPGLTTFADYRNRFAVYGEDSVRQQFAGTKDEMWALRPRTPKPPDLPMSAGPSTP